MSPRIHKRSSGKSKYKSGMNSDKFMNEHLHQKLDQSSDHLSLLIDPSMNPPIRVVNHGIFNESYIRACLLGAMEYR